MIPFLINKETSDRFPASDVAVPLSGELSGKMPIAEGLSVTNLRYCRRFYLLYSQEYIIRPQLEGELKGPSSEIHPQLGGELIDLKNQAIFNIPWGHHKLITN